MAQNRYQLSLKLSVVMRIFLQIHFTEDEVEEGDDNPLELEFIPEDQYLPGMDKNIFDYTFDTRKLCCINLMQCIQNFNDRGWDPYEMSVYSLLMDMARYDIIDVISSHLKDHPLKTAFDKYQKMVDEVNSGNFENAKILLGGDATDELMESLKNKIHMGQANFSIQFKVLSTDEDEWINIALDEPRSVDFDSERETDCEIKDGVCYLNHRFNLKFIPPEEKGVTNNNIYLASDSEFLS